MLGHSSSFLPVLYLAEFGSIRDFARIREARRMEPDPKNEAELERGGGGASAALPPLGERKTIGRSDS